MAKRRSVIGTIVGVGVGLALLSFILPKQSSVLFYDVNQVDQNTSWKNA